MLTFKKSIISLYKLASEAAAENAVSEYNVYIVDIRINLLRFFIIYLTI